MSCVLAPPAGPGEVEVRLIETIDEQLAALRGRLGRLAGVGRGAGRSAARWSAGGSKHCGPCRSITPPTSTGGSSGSGAASSLDSGIALMGGAVLPEARGRGVYRTLVRARWEHAVRRGTPLLVVQAGPMSEPILTGLGFESHGELRLYVDRL